MATPLDFSLEGLTPEQQRALQSYRGAAAAAAPGAGTITPQQLELARAAQRPLADIAGTRPAATTAARAPAATTAARAPAVPKLTAGQKALQFVRSATSLNPLKNPIIKGAGVLTGVSALAGGAADTAARTPEELSGRQADVATRALGLDTSTLPGRGVRAALDAAQSGFERLPILPGLMNLAAGLPYNGEATAVAQPAVSEVTAPAAAPAAAPADTSPPVVSSPRAGSREAAAATAFLAGRGVPESGRGVLRADQTGAITTFNAPPPVLARVSPTTRFTPPEVQPAAAPQLGTQGGIFTNLAQFQRDFGRVALAGAQDTRAFRRAETARAADIEQQTLSATQAKNALDAALRVAGLGIQQQGVDVARTAAEARGREQVEVIPGLPGEAPLLVGKQSGQARRATVVPAFEEFDAKMREDPRNSALTPEQMLMAYQEQFGQ